jgi:DNA polymerase III psi subunit
MLSAVIRITRTSPTTELRRPNRLQSHISRRVRAFARLLRTNNQRPPIHKRLIQRRISRVKRRVLTHPQKIRRTPKLPIILPIRLTTRMPIRNPTMLRHPTVSEIPKRGKVDYTYPVTEHRPKLVP